MPPRVLIMSSGEDIGGVGVGIVEAFRRHAPDWDVRFVRRADNYIGYPADIEWLPGADGTEVEELFARADVIHHVARWQELDGWKDKGKVIHHHGRAFRHSPEAWVAEARRHGAQALGSTLDLVAFDPRGMIWLPNPYDLDMLGQYRSPHANQTLRIAHAPTIRSGKSTEAFLAATERLAREVPIEVDVIERVSWEECLRRKARADIYYDQVFTAYGNNAIEAWGLGLPVVAGVDPAGALAFGMRVPPRTEKLMRSTWGELPFLPATESTIYDALRRLVEPDQRREWAERGRQHVRRWHSGEVVVAMLRVIYEGAA